VGQGPKVRLSVMDINEHMLGWSSILSSVVGYGEAMVVCHNGGNQVIHAIVWSLNFISFFDKNLSLFERRVNYSLLQSQPATTHSKG
jgi:hypothetical protein